jgi:hypothetical protein
MVGVDGWNSGMAEPTPHPVTIALAAAVTDPAATDRALTELDAIPALRRRRLLASYGALMTRST